MLLLTKGQYAIVVVASAVCSHSPLLCVANRMLRAMTMTNRRHTIVMRPISSDVHRGFLIALGVFSAIISTPSGDACPNSPAKRERGLGRES